MPMSGISKVAGDIASCEPPGLLGATMMAAGGDGDASFWLDVGEGGAGEDGEEIAPAAGPAGRLRG